MTEIWIKRIERRIARRLSDRASRAWVVAVSGGGDSMGLLRVLCRIAEPLALRLSVAHLNHGVRGQAASDDADFVAELAKSLGLPFELGQWQPARAAHFEADARRARYDWLTRVARQRGAGAIALGHTRDDQAETILHRILRGTGPRGLGGIPARRVLASDPTLTLVRPLLGVSRSRIRAFLSEIGQPFREDESNELLTRTRTRIRHDLLPKLAAEFNPAVIRALVRLGALSAAQSRALDRHVQACAQGVIVAITSNEVMLKHPMLRSNPRFLLTEILRTVWRRAGWPEASMSARRWRRLAWLARCQEISPVVVGASVLASSDGTFFGMKRLPEGEFSSTPARQSVTIRLKVPGRTEIPWAHCGIDASTDCFADRCGSEVVDSAQVSGVPYVRAPRPADRFDPLGMGGKSQPLADFFRGRRVPAADREKTPLLCDERGIIWVAGHRIAERVKVTSRTERPLWLRLVLPERTCSERVTNDPLAM